MHFVNFSSQTTAAVLAVALLAACEPKPPEPRAADAATALRATAVAETSTAAIILNDAPVQSTPPPPGDAGWSALEPGQDEESLAGLRGSVGKYPYDDTNYLEHGVLADRLRALLGAHYPQFLANMRTVSPLTEAGGLWYVTGNRPHAGGAEVAAVVIDPRRNALRVWLLSGGASREFVDPPTARIAWPVEVQTLRRNLGQAGE